MEKRLIFGLPLLCSMLSYELLKPEPSKFVKMPGRKRLGFGRLKETAFQIRFWLFLLQSPLRQCFCIFHKERERKKSGSCFLFCKIHCHKTNLTKTGGRKMFILWKNVCSVRKRAYKKAYLWLQTIAHSNKTQEKRMSN